MNATFGFFDVDCREIAPTGALTLRPRVQPLAERLQALYDYAVRHDLVTIFTTCCSGRMLERGSRDDILFVPLDADDTDWSEGVPDARLIYLQKKAYGDPRVNFDCRAYDMFADNPHAAHLLRTLDIPEWVVFGNGFDLCVNSAVSGILCAGYAVTLLTDLMIPCGQLAYLAERGFGHIGTEAYRNDIYAEFVRQGARLSTGEQLLRDEYGTVARPG